MFLFTNQHVQQSVCAVYCPCCASQRSRQLVPNKSSGTSQTSRSAAQPRVVAMNPLSLATVSSAVEDTSV